MPAPAHSAPPPRGDPAERSPSASSGSVGCRHCGQEIDPATYEADLWVCPFCRCHGRITPDQRLSYLVEPGSFHEMFTEVLPADPLHFVDRQAYPQRTAEAQARTGQSEAVRCGVARIRKEEAMLVLFNFAFLGGSMGSAVGERIVRAFEEAQRRGLGIITFSASGGARMQEGMHSLMQMAKTANAVNAFRGRRLPFISILTDPTTGGVASSFAVLGDVILAEPKAQIGFNGPRVVRDAFGHEVSEGAQRAEYLYEHGFIDGIIERKDQPDRLARLLKLFYRNRSGE